MTPKQSKKIAVFDIDGTIFRSSLLRELNMALVRYDIFPAIVKKETEQTYINWADRKDSYEKYIRNVIEVYMKRIPGVRVEDVKKVSKIVISEQKNRVYVFTRELIIKLRKSHTLIAISGSPIEIFKEFNRFWNFDYIIGTTYARKNGLYTGEVEDLPVANKESALKKLVDQHDLSFKGSTGVGDTEDDASFLKLLTKPICFNPNQSLYRQAKKKKWSVVVERKDVIYKL